MQSYISFRWILGILLLASAGCGSDSTGRVAIEGKVTYAGQPVKEGTIIFRSLDASLPEASAGIAEGTYQIPLQTGPKAGEYEVKITAIRMKKVAGGNTPPYLKSTDASSPNTLGMMPEQYLPAKYNSQTKLRTQIESSKFQYDFTLEK